MTDLANLVLAVDATQVKTGTASLDGLAAAGARAEAATIGLGGGMKGAGAEAAALAAGAQASARAAMDQAAGFKASASAASLNTIAMREILVVARELSRGNLTRIPGSLSLLAANVSGGIGGFAVALSTAIGLIKKVQNAELAEAESAAIASQTAIEASVKRAAANILAADTEVALAQAQIRVAEGSAAEAAGQERLSAAHVAVAAAAEEAMIAENALGAAIDRTNAASAAAAASTRTVIGGTGVALLGFGAIAAVAYGAIKQFQEQVKEDGSLTRFRDNLGLTHAEMLKLSSGVESLGGKFDKAGAKIKELGDVTVTFGDVMHGVWQEVSREVGSATAWDKTKSASAAAESAIIKGWLFVAENISAALNYAEDRAIAAWKNFPAAFGDIFVQAVNLAIGAINNLVKHGTDVLNTFISTANKIPGVNIGQVSAPAIGLMNNPNAGAALRGSAAVAGAPTYAQELARARAQDRASLANVANDAEQRRRDILQNEADALKADRHPKKPHKEPVDHAFDTIAQLDAQILAAKEKLAGTAEEQAAFAIQQIDVEKNKTIADAASKLAHGKITAAENQQIDALANQLAELKKQEVLRKKQTTLLTQQQAMIDQQFGFQEDALKTADQLATTQADHRRLQLEMLGIEFKQKEADLQILLAKQKIAGDLAGQALTQGKLDQLPTAFGQAQSLVLRNTQSPLEAWALQVPQDAAHINEALQSIEVKGLDSLAQSITDVITGTKNLGQAFADISKQIVGDILQMIIKMLLFRALSSALPGLFGGGSAAVGSTGVDTLSMLGSAKGNAFFGGNVIPFASGGIFNSPTLFPMAGGRTGLMGEAGPEAVMPLTRDSRGRLGVKAANDAQRGPIEIKIGFGDAPAFAPYVEQVAGAAAGQAVRISVDHTNKTMKAIGRPRITGGR